MSKKLWIAGALALALVVGMVGSAAAAPLADPLNPPGPRGGPGRGPNWPPSLVGEITSVGDSEFTMVGPMGGSYSIAVDEATAYLGSLAGFEDLKVGLEVGVVGPRNDDGSLLANVIALREELPFGTRIGGTVTAVSGSQISIETRMGEAFTFAVSADTDFLSRISDITSLTDVEVGDHVMIIFGQTSSGSLTANVILVAVPQMQPAN